MKLVVMIFMLIVGCGHYSKANGVDFFIKDMSGILLDGGSIPDDVYRRVIRLQPVDRYKAIVFLRRSGLLVGPAWPVDELLRKSRHPIKEEGE